MSSLFGWRATFLAEAAMMAPFALIFLFVPPPGSHKREVRPQSSALLSATDDDLSTDGVPASFGTGLSGSIAPEATPSLLMSLRALLANTTYVLIVLGYSVFTFVVGCLGLYVPAYVAEHLGIGNLASSLGFGGITAVAGLAGTALGGYVVDRRPHVSENARAVYSLKVAALCVGLGTPFSVAGILFGNSVYVLFPLLFVGELVSFMSTGPINGVTLSSVEPYNRSLAMSMNIMCIHMLGDLPSPLLIGQLLKTARLLYADVPTQQYILSAMLGLLLISALFFYAAAVVYDDRRRKQTLSARLALDAEDDDDFFADS